MFRGQTCNTVRLKKEKQLTNWWGIWHFSKQKKKITKKKLSSSYCSFTKTNPIFFVLPLAQIFSKNKKKKRNFSLNSAYEESSPLRNHKTNRFIYTNEKERDRQRERFGVAALLHKRTRSV